jgi:hypothetical protein
MIYMILCLIIMSQALYAQRFAVASGNWNGPIWATTVNGVAGSASMPTAANAVTINSGVTVIMNESSGACASLSISAASVSNGITISGTNSLAVTGGITMVSPTAVVNSTIDVGSGTLTCTGLAIPGSTTAGRNSIVTISTGTINCNSITFSGTPAQAQLIFTDAGTINVGNNTTGTISANTLGTITMFAGNTINYNGTNQTLRVMAYNNLSLSGSGTKTMGLISTISNNFALSGTVSATAGANLGIGGNLSVGTGSTLNLSTFTANRTSAGGVLTVAGTLQLGGTTGGQSGSNFPLNFSSLTLVNGTIDYSAAGIQTVFPTAYHHLRFSGSNVKSLSANASIDGNLTIASGPTFNLGVFTANRSSAGGVLTVTGTMQLGAITGGQTGSNFPLNFSTISLASGTVTYNSSGGAQTIHPVTYNNIIINNASGVALGNNIIANGVITFTTGNLTTNAFSVDLGLTGSLSSETSAKYLIGTVSSTKNILANSTAFTFGSIGASITAPTSTVAPGVTTVTRVTGTAITNNSASSILRYFTISPTTNSGLTCTLAFTHLNFAGELNGNAAATLSLYESNSPYSVWTDQGGTVAGSTITQTGITDFGRYTAADVNRQIGVPTITGFPPTGCPNQTGVVISGTNLRNATALTIGGISATITARTINNVTVTIGNGSNGSISVTTPGGVVTSGSGMTMDGPSSPASGFSTSLVSTNSMTVSWARGNGDQVIVLAATNPINANPTLAIGSYTADAVSPFTSGTTVGNAKVVYIGTGTSVALSNLLANTSYYFQVSEYSASNVCYTNVNPAITQVTSSQNYYWVGGSGNWSDFANHWATSSGGAVFHTQVPTANDNVFFDANSFTNVSKTVTINQTLIACNNMDWTGALFTPVLATTSSSNAMQINGSLTFIAAMTNSFNGTVNFTSSNIAPKSITSAGKTFPGFITFNGATGVWTLQDALTSSGTITLTSGTLNTNNQTVTANIFSSSNSNVRTLNLGSSTFNLSYALWFWDIATSTNLTLNAGTSTINGIVGMAGFSQSFRGGGLNYYNLNFNATNTSGATIEGNNTFNNVVFNNHGAITGNNTFNNLTFSPGFTYTLTNSRTQNIIGNFIANGTCTAGITILSNSGSISSTINKSSGVVTLNYVSLTRITASGGATFIAENSIDGGNNSGWTINSGGAGIDLYWIGNGGNWNDGSHWSTSSGGSAYGCSPGLSDNVFFDANSFNLNGQTVTINVPTASCNNMSWTGVTNTPAFASVNTNTLRVFGSLTLVSGMTLTSGGFQATLNFQATTAGQTIITAGKTFGNAINFNGIGGGWTLQDALSTTNTISLNHGSLNTNGQTVTANIFSSNNSNVRTLSLGSSTFNLSYALWFWDIGTSTNLTLNAGTSTINGNVGMAGFSQSFRGGGLSYYNLNLNATNTNGTTIEGNNTFNNVVFNNHGAITGSNIFNNLTFSPGFTYILTNGRTQTINNSINANGSCSSVITIRSSASAATTITKSSGAVVFYSVDLLYVNAIGGASYTAYNSIDSGNNNGWTINSGGTGQNLYWIGNGGNWNDGSHWSTSSGGPAYGCAPGSNDDVFFDANSFSLSGQTVTISTATASCRSMSWTGVTNNPAFVSANTNTLRVFGSLTLVPGMTLTSGGFQATLNFLATSTGHTVITAGKTFGNAINFNGIGGGWTLQDALSTTNTISLNHGSLNTNDQTVTANIFSSNNSNVRTLILGSSTFNLSYALWFWDIGTSTNLTLNAGTSTINGNVGMAGFSQSFRGGGLSYYNLNLNATTTNGTTIEGNNTFNNVSFFNNGAITGNNTFNNLNFTPAFTYTITSGRTQTITGNLNISGTGSFPVRVQSSTSGSFFTFSKSTGLVCADYIWISDSRAQGGATYNAGTNSLDLGGNTGWRFPGQSVSPTSLIASATPLCNTGSQSSNLTQTGGSLGNLAVWQWYSDAAYTIPEGGPLTSADAALTVLPMVTTTYYLRAQWPECIPPLAGPPSGVTITINPVPTINTSGVIDPVCFSANSQTTELDYSATSDSPINYTITWIGLANQGTTASAFLSGGGTINNIAVPAGVAANSYNGTLTISNASNCTSQQPVSIIVNQVPNLSVNNPDAVCQPVTVELNDPVIVTDLNGATGTLSFFSTLTDANNNTNPISSQVETTGTYYIKKTTSEGCTDVNPVTVTVNICTITWYGTLSTQWDDGRNWNAAGVPGPIPTSSVNVFIPPATDVPFSPVIPAGVNGVCNNIYFYTGASLTIASGQILDVKGNWEAEAPLVIQGEGSVRFSRAIAGFQSIFGSTTFPNFISANLLSSLYIQSGMQTVTRVLQLATGALYGGGRITLASDASNTALIDDFSSGFTGSIVGNVTVRRHIAGSRGYRYLSNPINQSAGLTVLNFGPSVTGANGVIYDPNNPPGPTGFPTCWIYNENDANAVESQNPQSGWVSATTAATQLQSMKGYGVIINGTQTLSFTGPPNTGNFNISISYTSSGKAVSDGYNLIGNPYPSPVSWNAIRALPGNSGQITSIMKRWSNSGDYLGQYADWNGVVGTNGATDNIALGQAFFVKSLPGASSMVMQNSVRRSLPGASFFEEQPVEQPGNLLRLKISGEKGADEAVIYFDPNAKDTYDAHLDVVKFMALASGLPNLFTLVNGDRMSINAMNQSPGYKIVPMGLTISQSGIYTLDVTELKASAFPFEVYLEDREAQQKYDLQEIRRVTFTFGEGQLNNRFFLHFGSSIAGVVPSQSANSGLCSLYPQPAVDRVVIKFNDPLEGGVLKIHDISGRLILTRDLRNINSGQLIEVDLVSFTSGIYHAVIMNDEKRMLMPFVISK